MPCQYGGLVEIGRFLFATCRWKTAAIPENTYSVHHNYEEACGEFISHFKPTCHKTTEIRLLMSHKF